MASSKLSLDISGLPGLAPNWAGDLNSTVAAPQLRYLGQPGQMANGIWDPLRVQGYMSPANNTYTALTGSISQPIVSAAYSASADTTYLAEAGYTLDTISTLSGTSITSTQILTGNSYFYDLELYEINNTEALFYAYNDAEPSVSSQQNLTLGFLSTDRTKGAYQIASQVYEALPFSSTQAEQLTTTGYQQLAQSFGSNDFFTIGTYPVSGIRVRIEMPFVGVMQSWTLAVSIQTDSGGTPSGTNVTGAAGTISASALPVGYYDYFYVTFTNTVFLTAGTAYHIVLKPTGAFGAPNQGIYWLASAAGSTQYSDGQVERYDGAVWSTDNTASFDFALIVNNYNYIGASTGSHNIDEGVITIGTNSTSAYVAAATSLTYTQNTTSQSKPCIVVGVIVTAGDIVTSVTCGGVAMTQVVKQDATDSGSGGSFFQYMYTATGMTSGSNSIVVTTSGSTKIVAFSNDYYGVNQTTPSALGFAATSKPSRTTAYSFNTTGPAINSLPIVLGHVSNANGNTGIELGTGITFRVGNANDVFSQFGDAGTPRTAYPYAMTIGPSTINPAMVFAVWITIQVDSATEKETVPAIAEYGVNATTFLHSAQNGFLYWFTNSRVHKFDGGQTASTTTNGGTPGNFTADVLDFPSYIKAVDACDTNNMLYIAIQSSALQSPDHRNFPSTVIGVYTWNYQSILSTIANYYPAPGARSISRIFLNNEGAVRLITIGEDGFTEIRGLQYGEYQTLFKLGLNSYPATRDSLSYLNNGMVTWLGADGFTYLLGHPTPTAQVAYIAGAEAVYKIGNTNGLQVGTYTPGIMITGNINASQSQDGALISYHDSSSGNKVVRWYPHGVGTINGVAQQGNAGNVYNTVQMFPSLAKINYIHVYFAPVGAASATVMGTIKTFVNQSTTAIRTDSVTAADIAKGYKYIKIGQALQSGVFALQFEIIWPTNTTLSTTADMMPRFIEIDYDPIVKLY